MPSVSLALAKLQGSVDVGFERVDGSVRLILQRLDQVDDRHADLARRVDEQDARLAEVERTAVTHDQLSNRTKMIIAVVTVLLLVTGTVISLISLTQN
ncbi:hypothetical protein ACU635_43380 [[Actinomadura] parvosata]|uniref:hypothetical protein n=1 Tax=[Actinomadura] parvosata TaxID=1955412 RepID=UPI00406C492A